MFSNIKISGEAGEKMAELLKVSELKKSFEDGIVLNEISFSVEKGEVVVVIGPSGCGKSTLLRCLNGLESIQGGSISLDGEHVDYSKKESVAARQKIGMVFQSYDLFPHMSILKNITLAPVKVQKRNKQDVEEEAKSLLERVGLADKVNAFPRQLSGGQKQRVAIVRALIMHPEILLLDEITAALDPEMVREVLQVVLELAKSGMTMLIITHEMEFAKAVADRVLFIDEGKIIEDGEPKQFFNDPRTDRAKKFLNTFHYEEIPEVKEEPYRRMTS